MTLTWFDQILSPLKRLFGMKHSEHEQIQAILMNSTQNAAKDIMENLMMMLMAENLRNRLAHHVDINFIERNHMEL